MPESENDQTPANDTGHQQPSFGELIEGATFDIGSARGRDTADEFEGSMLNPEDLLTSEFDEHLETIREVNPKRADALEAFRKQVQEAQERTQAIEEKEARDDRKDVLRALPADKRVAEDDTDRELLAEIERETFEASPAGQIIEQATEQTEQVKALLTDIRKGRVPFEESYEKVQEILSPAWELADVVGDPERSPAARVDAWEAATPIVQEMASRWFGIVPTFDLDVDSDSYREGVEAHRTVSAEDAEWAQRMINLGGDE